MSFYAVEENMVRSIACRKIRSRIGSRTTRWTSLFMIVLAGIAANGCGARNGTATETPGARAVTSISAQELQAIRRDRRDVVLVDRTPPSVPARVIKMVGLDRNGQLQVFFLDLCSGKLYNVFGQIEYHYPGEWGGPDC
ncbi:MAG: hypothetical protein JST22_09045 [Bacteroidetes bacterium]|nr:hypothetical protein [Bacteroidota bacterium]